MWINVMQAMQDLSYYKCQELVNKGKIAKCDLADQHVLDFIKSGYTVSYDKNTNKYNVQKI